MPFSEREQIYGTDELPVQSRTLTAGSLEVELDNGQVRYVRFGGVEVLRAISFLARDRYWGTFAATIDDLSVEQSPGQFTVAYKAQCVSGGVVLRYEVEIAGDGSGRLSFKAGGAPSGDFPTNRTGFVVLHPIDGVVGTTVSVDHASGGSEKVILPALISPREPATDIFAITHEAAPGLEVRVEMTGDAYDMEDQRNWTDASLKTYIRPLSKPKPYVMPGGERFEQSVTVTITAKASTVAAASAPSLVTSGEPLGRMPAIALGLDGADVDRSRHQLPPGIATIIGRPGEPSEIAAIATIAEEAGAALSLQFAIAGHDPDVELRAWKTAENAASVLVTPYRLYPLRPAGIEPGTASLEAIAHAARSAFPRAAIGGGVMTGFTEFNRNRPRTQATDFVTHVTSAIVHTADDRSVVETLDALPHVFRSALALAGGKPYRLGPSGIGLGLNPDGPPRRADTTTNGRATMIRNDPRQRGLFAASWTLGYAVAVVKHGLNEYSPAHIAGDFGLFEDDGALRPIYHVVRAMAAYRDAVVTEVTGLPSGCRGLAWGSSIWVANLTPSSQHLAFNGSVRSKTLDTGAFADAARDPEFFDRSAGQRAPQIELLPFAVAKVTP